MKNALIFHGTEDNSQKNWFPWLKKELENKGYKVWVPDLPRADKPNIQRYNKFIFGNENWKFNKESVLIGHSSGAVAILGVLQELPKDVVIDTAILVAGFTDNLNWDALDELFLKPFDWKKIKKQAKKIILIHSDDDPYVALSYGEELKNKLDAELIVEDGQKHFSMSTAGEKYREFPLILKLLNI